MSIIKSFVDDNVSYKISIQDGSGPDVDEQKLTSFQDASTLLGSNIKCPNLRLKLILLNLMLLDLFRVAPKFLYFERNQLF